MGSHGCDCDGAGAISSAEDADYQKESLGFRIADFLRTKGWRHTSTTPGSYWLWEKTVDGRVLLMDQSMALSIQRHLDGDELTRAAAGEP